MVASPAVISIVGWLVIAGIVFSSLLVVGFCIMTAGGHADELLDRMMRDRYAREAEHNLEAEEPPEYHKP